MCTEGLCTNCSRERWQITHMYAEGLRLATSPPALGESCHPRVTPQWALSWHTRNHSDCSPAQDFAAPRRAHHREYRRGALRVTCKPRRGVPRRSPGGGPASFWKVCQPKSSVLSSQLLLLVSPGASDFCRLLRRRQIRVRRAVGSGPRAPRRMGTRLTAPGECPGCSPGYYSFILGLVPFPCWRCPGAAGRWELGCSLCCFYASYAFGPPRGKRHLPTCWSFAK